MIAGLALAAVLFPPPGQVLVPGSYTVESAQIRRDEADSQIFHNSVNDQQRINGIGYSQRGIAIDLTELIAADDAGGL